MRRVMAAHDLRVLLPDSFRIVLENAADNLAVEREPRYPMTKQQSSTSSLALKGVIEALAYEYRVDLRRKTPRSILPKGYGTRLSTVELHRRQRLWWPGYSRA